MKCPKCRFDNCDIAKFCEQCGTSLARECPYCDSEVSRTARFCSKCGRILTMRVKQEAIHAIIYGLVQRVHFRIFVLQNARVMGLTGYVRNLSSEKALEVVAEGERKKLKQLVRQLKKGPKTARVQRVVVNWSKYSGGYNHFGIKS